MRSQNISFLSYIRESASRNSATQNIWVSPAMLSLLTSFYSFLLCFFSPSAGLTWTLCQTWGFWPNSTRIKWLENHRGPFQMSQLFEAGTQLPSACAANTKAVKGPDVFIYMNKKHAWCLECIWQDCKSEWYCIYATNTVWPLHCQTTCVFSCSILCGHGTLRRQHLLPNPD